MSMKFYREHDQFIQKKNCLPSSVDPIQFCLFYFFYSFVEDLTCQWTLHNIMIIFFIILFYYYCHMHQQNHPHHRHNCSLLFERKKKFGNTLILIIE